MLTRSLYEKLGNPVTGGRAIDLRANLLGNLYADQRGLA